MNVLNPWESAFLWRLQAICPRIENFHGLRESLALPIFLPELNLPQDKVKDKVWDKVTFGYTTEPSEPLGRTTSLQ